MTKKQKREREHAIKSYLKGESITGIATKLGHSRRWVYRWIQRYEESGEEKRCASPSATEIRIRHFLGFRSLSLTQPKALMLVAFGDRTIKLFPAEQ